MEPTNSVKKPDLYHYSPPVSTSVSNTTNKIIVLVLLVVFSIVILWNYASSYLEKKLKSIDLKKQRDEFKNVSQ
jgi:hypothetical protein